MRALFVDAAPRPTLWGHSKHRSCMWPYPRYQPGSGPCAATPPAPMPPHHIRFRVPTPRRVRNEIQSMRCNARAFGRRLQPADGGPPCIVVVFQRRMPHPQHVAITDLFRHAFLVFFKWVYIWIENSTIKSSTSGICPSANCFIAPALHGAQQDNRTRRMFIYTPRRFAYLRAIL